jgi:hypothetical protein
MADSPALRELGVVDGPTGLSAVAGKGLAILGRVVDFFRKLLGGHQEPKRGAGPPAAVVTDVSELQQGVAAAAKHIRERKKLPSGQP